MIKNSTLRNLYNYFIEHWVISATISSIPGILYTLVEIFGNNIGIRNSSGNLTQFVFYSLLPIFVISSIFNYAKALADKKDEQAKQNGQFIVKRTIESLDEIKHKKLNRFVNYIEENHRKNGLSPFVEITQPRVQIETIMEYFQDTLSDIFDIPRHDIGMSILFKTDLENRWKWIYAVNTESDLTIKEIIDNPKTTTRQIIDGKTSSLFLPSKKTGSELGLYVPGKKDVAHKMIGSIICRNIGIGTKNCLNAVLSITTYGKQFCLDNDIDARYKIEEMLLPSFERRIQLELALYYIKEVMAKSQAT